MLSVADMGVYYFLLSISSAFGLVYANPIGMYANRMIHSWLDHGVLLKNLKVIITSLFIGSLLTIPFLFLFKQKISLDDHHWLALVCILVFYVFASTFNGTIIPSLNLLGFTNNFVVWTLLTNVLGLLISYLLVKLVSPHPLNWLIGQGIGFVFCAVVAYAILAFRINDKKPIISINQITRLERVAKFSIPIVITNLAVWVLGQSFRFFYKENVDLTILGELAFGLGMATSLCVAVEYLFQQLYLPDFYKKINNSSESKSAVWNSLLQKLIPPYVFVTFFLIGLSPFILRVLADVKFKNSVKYLALGAVVEIFRMFGNVFTMATHSEMKTYKTVGPYLAGGAITLIGILYICKHPQLVAFTPFCLILGHLTALTYLTISVKRMFEFKLPVSTILKCILISSIFLSALLLSKFSDNLLNSILINVAYGLILILFLYQSYKKSRTDLYT